MPATSPFSEVEDVQTVPRQDFVREVSVPESPTWTEITVENRCYYVELWDKALTSEILWRHRANDDTFTETIPANVRALKGNTSSHHSRRVEDSHTAMRPGESVGFLQSPSGSGTLTVVVKEVTNV